MWYTCIYNSITYAWNLKKVKCKTQIVKWVWGISRVPRYNSNRQRWGFSYTNEQFSDTSRVYQKSPHFQHCLPGDSTRSHRLWVQSRKTSPTPSLPTHFGQKQEAQALWTYDQLDTDWKFQWLLWSRMPIASPGCCLNFWLTSYKSEVPTAPSLGLINLLGMVHSKGI